MAHGVKQRGFFITLNDLDVWIKNQPDVDLYSSFFASVEAKCARNAGPPFFTFEIEKYLRFRF